MVHRYGLPTSCAHVEDYHLRFCHVEVPFPMDSQQSNSSLPRGRNNLPKRTTYRRKKNKRATTDGPTQTSKLSLVPNTTRKFGWLCMQRQRRRRTSAQEVQQQRETKRPSVEHLAGRFGRGGGVALAALIIFWDLLFYYYPSITSIFNLYGE